MRAPKSEGRERRKELINLFMGLGLARQTFTALQLDPIKDMINIHCYFTNHPFLPIGRKGKKASI